MLKKELLEIWKPALLRLAAVPVMLLLPALQAMLSDLDISNWLLHIFILTFGIVMFWIASHLGTSFFRSEYQDRALEYFLTFPISRLNTIGLKLIARVLVLLLLSGAYFVAAKVIAAKFEGDLVIDNYILNPVFLPFWCLCFLGIGFFCGFMEDRNRRALAVFITFLSIVIIPLGLISLFGAGDPAYGIAHTAKYFVLGFVLLFLILGSFFVPVFRNFDLRSFSKYEKRMQFLVLPILVFFDVVCLVHVFL
jgi:ABC-type transport system involved in multi-copper enzyme maturation permease subunit